MSPCIVDFVRREKRRDVHGLFALDNRPRASLSSSSPCEGLVRLEIVSYFSAPRQVQALIWSVYETFIDGSYAHSATLTWAPKIAVHCLIINKSFWKIVRATLVGPIAEKINQ